MVVFLVATFAFSGGYPDLVSTGIALLTASIIGVRNWRAENKLAQAEDKILMQAFVERQRAFDLRNEMWGRLVHCRTCSLVVDPITQRSATVYDLHELASEQSDDQQAA